MSEKKKTKPPAKKKSAKPTKARKKAPAKSKAPAKKATKKAGKPTVKRKSALKAPKKAFPGPVYEHLFDNPLIVKRTIYGLFAVSGILFILDFFVDRHVYHPWEGFFGFYAIYGFVACVVLVLVAKEMRKVLMRGQDYYDE